MIPMRKYEYVIIRNDKEIGINEYGFDYLINLEKVLDEIREYIKEQIDYLTKIDGQNIPLNDKFKFCSMNELYQTGKYSGFKEVQDKLEEILDKVKE